MSVLEADAETIIASALSRLSKEEYLLVLRLEVEVTKGFIAYWQASVISGDCKNRKITRGDGHVLTHDELVSDAMKTLETHCHRLGDLTDLYKTVLLHR